MVIAGFTLLFVGVAMLILPGPAIIVIPAALAILATEFVWARRLMEKVKSRIGKKKIDSNRPSSSTRTR